MLILITILIRKPTWIGPTFANNVPATRVAAGAVVGAAERARREVFVIQLSLSHGSLEWVVNDPSCILCHVGTVNFSSHQCNGHCINTHQTYCMAVSTVGVGGRAIDSLNLKSDSLQYNTLVLWADGTND